MKETTFTVRRAAVGDEPLLRAIRIEALGEAPEAFGSTLERELARTQADWQKWLSPSATFLLETDAGPQGIVAGVPDAKDASVVHLMAMWIHPAFRGTGTAAALVQTVLDWAEGQGASRVRLDVIDENERARRFYEKCGFEVTGEFSIRALTGAREIRMEKKLKG